jgi:DNA topoisomerase-3
LYNRFTEEVYPLPTGGVVKEWAGRKCTAPGCNFEICTYTVGQPPRTFPLCPNCFNSADWALSSEDEGSSDPVDREDENKERQIKRMAGKALTLECPLPDSHPLIDDMTVSPDPDSDGVLIVDPHMGPKWRLVSTRDPTIVYLPQSIDKLTILNRKDDVLGCHYMKIEFKAGESPLESGETMYTCCFPTDQLLQNNVRVYHGSDRLKASGRGGRGRGRGRGRGGRGGRGRRR